MSPETLPRGTTPKRSSAWRLPGAKTRSLHDHREMTQLADKLEPQFEARVIRASERMASSIDLDRLTLAIAKGNVEEAVRASLTSKQLQEVMGPVETLIKSNLVRGGNLGARQLNQLVKDLG